MPCPSSITTWRWPRRCGWLLSAFKPDCVAVELAETMQLQLLHAASRLPDISIVITYDKQQAADLLHVRTLRRCL